MGTEVNGDRDNIYSKVNGDRDNIYSITVF